MLSGQRLSLTRNTGNGCAGDLVTATSDDLCLNLTLPQTMLVD